jgi:hypothetical protein
MKKQTLYNDPDAKSSRDETPVRPLMNSLVNPEGIVPEPISEVVQKSEQDQQQQEAAPHEQTKQQPIRPQQQQAQKPAKKKAEQKPGEKSKKDDLLNTRVKPQLESEEKDTFVGGDRQMQSDLRYTSVMKKDKDMKKNEAEEKVDGISDRSDKLLMKLKTVFPFDFFPSTVAIDANKVIIIDKMFFASETVTSILLEEITDVVVNSNFFLAQLEITYSHHPLRPLKYAIANLKKEEALKASEIIQGLLVLRISEGIDLSKLQPEEIIKELANIGKSHENISTL